MTHPAEANSRKSKSGVSEERIHKGSILVFTGELLPPSQTFVRDHVEHIREFDRVLLGVRRVRGLDLSHLPTATLPQSRVARLVLSLLGYSPKIDDLVRSKGVVAIHAHFADGGMKMARYAARRNLPLFVTLHGSDVLSVRKPAFPVRLLNTYLSRGMKNGATLFLAVSDYLRRSAIAAGYPEERVRTHFIGVPLTPSPETPAAGDTGAPPIILFVGRLVEKKGLSYLLKACSLLRESGCSFKLRIAGDGPLASRHRQEAKALGSQVEFLGFLSTAEVREQLSDAQIFCMPSTRAPNGDNEGLGLVYLEAQAAGVPVVAFNQGPVPEAVLDGQTGMLAEDKSVEGLAEALKVLIENPDLRMKMGVAGQRFVRERFDIQMRSRELDRLYSSVVAGNRGSSWQR